MTPLPQTTIDRIEKEAEHVGRMLCSNQPFEAARIAYSRGAHAEATRASPLYEALKLAKQLLNAYAIRHKDTAQLLLGYTNEEAFTKLDNVLASCESGEEPVHQLPTEVIATQEWDEDGSNKTGWSAEGWRVDGVPITGYTLKDILESNKYGDPTKAIFVRDECEPVQGKEAKEFAEWITLNYSPDYNSISGIKQWKIPVTSGPFYSIHELFEKWQQSLKQ
jgi:hypothetical protein